MSGAPLYTGICDQHNAGKSVQQLKKSSKMAISLFDVT